MKKQEHIEYIIKQTRVFTYKNIESLKEGFLIAAKNCVHELLWFVSYEDEYFDYEDCVVNNTILLNGFDILSKRTSMYNKLIDHTNHYVFPEKKNCTEFNDNIYSYSFSLYSTQYQPSGVLNMSKIEKCELVLEFNPNIRKKKFVKIFANSYNVLRVNRNGVDILF